jgi:hypothetical protein
MSLNFDIRLVLLLLGSKIIFLKPLKLGSWDFLDCFSTVSGMRCKNILPQVLY